MNILTRPEYIPADTLRAFITLNLSTLARYWKACDEAIRLAGGPASPVDEWPYFCEAQFDSWQRDNLEVDRG